MCLSAIDVKEEIMLMVKKVEKPLTPKVLKDVYLFVSQLEAINFDISLLLQKRGFLTEKI